MIEEKITTEVKYIRNLSDSLYIVGMNKKNVQFIPGQHIALNLPGEDKARLYSIASGANDDNIEVLIREIKGGDLSVRFRNLNPGDSIVMTNPVGYFCIPPDADNANIICIATGSGVAPFRSFANTHKQLKFTVVHGVRDSKDSVQQEFSDNTRYLLCTSRSKEGDFHGRVTDYVKSLPISENDLFYLCGNGEMIHEVFSYLRKNGVKRESVYYEEYFNN